MNKITLICILILATAGGNAIDSNAATTAPVSTVTVTAQVDLAA